jgi:hypothetical protein
VLEGDLYNDGVNVAARLESLVESWLEALENGEHGRDRIAYLARRLARQATVQ